MMPSMKGSPKATKGKPLTTLSPQLFDRVRDILALARDHAARTVNTTQVVTNWLIGREIVEAQQSGKRRADYGTELLRELAANLTREFGRGYSVDNLEAFRQFYLSYPDLISETASRISFLPPISETVSRNSAKIQPADTLRAGVLNPNLSWSHYRSLLKVDRPKARSFYELEAAHNGWSVREMERQIGSLLFDRLAKSKDKKGLMRLAVHGHEIVQPIDVLKDPVVLEFLDLPAAPRLVESKLEEALIGNLQTFLLELGKGFAFVARQERITINGDHFYVDLVFYHTILKCYVLIDLKVGKLTHADLGQIQFYVNYYDRERRTAGDNPTLGLILCPDKNDAVVQYTLGDQLKRNIFARRYQLHLPTEDELKHELQRELRYLTPGTSGTKKPKKARRA